ncbi:hypothetical protein [Psychrobacillus vulpis]|uniref:RNA polymerase II n=1 Tax=Psychrobacillus vulpis TaxID=2325572 RepID=A0A544TK88_9BACI|nr:hypothetical protein [Psychrobacillus vulpis]TQR17838.1 hypothetical protein FG384_17100 [Psychrobacillus vulpis]
MKIVVSFLSMILIVVNSVLLLFQYHVYSSSLEEEGKSFFYEQDIEVKLKKDRMIVKQHFKNIPNEELNVSWPISSENRSCNLSQGDTCSRLSEDLNTFKEGDASNQSISYEIPLLEGIQDGKILSGIFANLEKGGVSYTTLHITDELKRGGMWVSGLPIIGNTSLDLIDYTLAYGPGNITELYWQKEVIPVMYEDDYFTFYSKKEVSKELLSKLNQLHLPNSEHVAVFLSENNHITNTSRIVFFNDENIAAIQRELIVNNVQSTYGLDSNESLLAEVISSYLLNQPIGSEKAIWMYETLNNYFTSKQLEEWKTAITKNKQLNAEKMDELLSKTLDLKTSFFTFNVQSKEDYFPLLFEDPRTVYINELQQEDMKILFKDGKILYPAEPLLSVLGYSLNETNKGLYVQNATRAFRFPIQEPFYVLNEKRYDAMSEPFEKIGSVRYIEEAWMIRLFLLDIEKQDKRVNITQSALF